MTDEPGSIADLIRSAAEAAVDFRSGLADRPVARAVDRAALLTALGGPLPARPTAPDRVIDDLVSAVDAGLVATAGPRFFGFVVGGSLPAATAADVLTVGWDQLAFDATSSPAASVVEGVAGGWLKELLGLGAASVAPVAADVQGAIDIADLARVLAVDPDAPTILVLQYDCGLLFCADPTAHAAAASYTAAYLAGAGAACSASDYVLESSRRARGFAVWAALRELGSSGVADLVSRCCALARRFADGLAAGGVRIVNDVVLNQVLVSFGADERADAVIDAVQREGRCALAGTTWRGRRLMRVSVSNWSTTADDVDHSVAAVLRVAAGL